MTAKLQRERPIIFSGPMVRAILDGRKTQTRRVVRAQDELEFIGCSGDNKADPRLWAWRADGNGQDEFVTLACDLNHDSHARCPYGAADDLLWVRETWADLRGGGFGASFAYKADSVTADGREDADSKRCRTDFGVKWKPSIHMPREASRLTLRVTEVRVQRVQDITGDDAGAEGCASGTPYEFSLLWDSINEKRGFGWNANPWAWALTFKIETVDRENIIKGITP